MAIYLFDRKGQPLLAMPSGDPLPIEPKQMEGVLALAGTFAEDGARGPDETAVTRVEYDRLGILAMSGEYAVAAAVSNGPPSDLLVPELRRFLRRCEKRMRRHGTE